MTSKHYSDGFEVWTVCPVPVGTDVKGQSLVIEIEAKLFIEPDESVGDTDWWIADVIVHAAPRAVAQLGEYELAKADPLRASIIAFATKHDRRRIDAEWHAWLADRPRRRA